MRISEAKSIIHRLLPTGLSMYLWGSPGVGKSDSVRQVVSEINAANPGGEPFQLVDIRASLLDPVDLRGLPSVAGGITKWNPPIFLPTKGKGVLFLDEIGQAPTLVQGALLQLVLDKKLGEYELPPNWSVIAASNRSEDRAGVGRIITPLLNRFTHLDITVNPDDWHEWAVQNNVAPEVTSFIKFKTSALFDFKPDSSNLRAFASPRSWSFASTVVNAFRHNGSVSLGNGLREALIGCVGEGGANEFAAHLQLCEELPDPITVLKNPSKATIPSEPSVLWALIGTMAQKVRNTPELADNYLTFAMRLKPEFIVMCMKDMLMTIKQEDKSRMVTSAKFLEARGVLCKMGLTKFM